MEYVYVDGDVCRYECKVCDLVPVESEHEIYRINYEEDHADYATKHSNAPICYNGDLCNKTQIEEFSKKYPQIKAVMLGRALIADPGLFSPGGTDISQLEAFHDELLENYIETFGSARNAMFRLKENWHMLLCKFENSEKLGKRLRKTTDVAEFRIITKEIFSTLPLKNEITPSW